MDKKRGPVWTMGTVIVCAVLGLVLIAVLLIASPLLYLAWGMLEVVLSILAPVLIVAAVVGIIVYAVRYFTQ